MLLLNEIIYQNTPSLYHANIELFSNWLMPAITVRVLVTLDKEARCWYTVLYSTIIHFEFERTYVDVVADLNLQLLLQTNETRSRKTTPNT